MEEVIRRQANLIIISDGGSDKKAGKFNKN